AAVLWPHRQIAKGVAFFTSSEARRALAAWVFATLWVAATAVAGNSALEGRKAEAASSILGVPTMLQAPAPRVEKGSVEEQLAEARAEARKWKETLDDDRKLQFYLDQKAREDFNRAEVAKLDLSRAPSQGSTNAPISVVSFSDFMCPFCRDLAAGLKNFLPTTGNQIQARYKHFPLDGVCNTRIGQTIHPGACDLALGGICAEESGLFWEYHDKVFAQRWDRATREDVLKIGASVGLDGAKLKACMDSAAAKGILAKDIDEGWKLGVGSTPTMFVNGRKLQSTGVFLLAIEEERKRLKLPVVTGAPAQEK
ncbi:MAG: DsbA family protein, partial [Vicinamibacteria bacterium]|nr:DsbA family protein [Vicinamibacteria bacterium]